MGVEALVNNPLLNLADNAQERDWPIIGGALARILGYNPVISQRNQWR